MVSPEHAGGAYQLPYDNVPERPLPEDPDFLVPQNPDGSEVGPLVRTPEGEQWIQENVYSHGYVIDWGNREIFDPYTGEVKGTVPKSVPRMT